MKFAMFEAHRKKGILCHDLDTEPGRVFDVVYTNRLPNYKSMLCIITRGPPQGSVCISQGEKTLTYIYSLSKELGYICTQSVSCRRTHADVLPAEGRGLLSITWPWDKQNLGLWHQSRPLLDHTSMIGHMCSHHKNIMGKLWTAVASAKRLCML